MENTGALIPKTTDYCLHYFNAALSEELTLSRPPLLAIQAPTCVLHRSYHKDGFFHCSFGPKKQTLLPMLFSFPSLAVRRFTLAVPTLTKSSSSDSFPLKSSEAHRFPSLTSNTTTGRSSSDNDTTYSANAINAILPTCFSQPPTPLDPTFTRSP